MDSVVTIALGSAVFLLAHLVPSHPPVRAALVGVLGEGPFRGLYSLVVGGAFAIAAFVWWTDRHAGAALWVWRSPVAVHVAEALIALGFGLAVAGAVRAAPSSMTASGGDRAPRGFEGLTRHPVNMGASLIALGHLIVNGWAGDVAFWAGLLGVGVLGGAHQDWRLRTTRPAYAAFAEKTTFFPIPKPGMFAPIDRVSAVAFVVGVTLAVVVRVFHQDWIG